MSHIRILFLITFTFLFPSFVFGLDEGDTITLPDFDCALAESLLHEDNCILLDIRTEAEYQSDHIKGAVFIPFLDFPSYLGRIAQLTGGRKDCPMVLYCRTGRRAGIVKKVLIQEGYSRVTNMGGLKDWRDRGK